jgi:hypothetical protein
MAVRSGMWDNGRMGNLNRLSHPGWLGVVLPLVVLPLALTIVSTFTPGTVRAGLLITAVVAAVWTFHKTDYAGQNLKKTGPAAVGFLVIALVVFFIGRAMDTPAKAVQVTAQNPAISPVEVPAPQAKQQIADAPKGKKAPQVKNAAPLVPPINQRDCGVVQIGGSGNQASPNCGAPPPKVIVTRQGDPEIRKNYRGTKDSYVTTFGIAIPDGSVPILGLIAHGDSVFEMEAGRPDGNSSTIIR